MKEKKNDPSWKKLSGMELLVFAAEVKSSGDEKFLDEITDFIKEKNLSTPPAIKGEITN